MSAMIAGRLDERNELWARERFEAVLREALQAGRNGDFGLVVSVKDGKALKARKVIDAADYPPKGNDHA